MQEWLCGLKDPLKDVSAFSAFALKQLAEDLLNRRGGEPTRPNGRGFCRSGGGSWGHGLCTRGAALCPGAYSEAGSKQLARASRDRHHGYGLFEGGLAGRRRTVWVLLGREGRRLCRDHHSRLCGRQRPGPAHPRDGGAFKRIGSEHKWLEAHGRKKWAYYYTPESLRRQEAFFGHFLKGDRGRHLIHTGGWYDSHLLVPRAPG